MGWFGTLLERFVHRRPVPVVTVTPPVKPVAAAAPRRPTPPVEPLDVATAPARANPAANPPAAATKDDAPPETEAEIEAREAEAKRKRDRAQLEQSFRSSIVDPRFQQLDIDARFGSELATYIARSQASLALPPAAAFDVMRLVDQSGYHVRKVGAAISCDPTLAGAVLSMANSPLHRGDVDVDSVPNAVVRLGQRQLKLLLLDIALHSTKVRGRPFEQFCGALWKHSLLTAQLAHGLAQKLHLDPDHAYMAGLFHDIGSFAVIAAARRLALREERKVSAATLLSCVRQQGYGLNGPIVASWRLPDAVARAVTFRRDPEQAGDAARMAAVTELANDLSRPLGAWVEPRAVDFVAHPLMRQLGLAPEQLPSREAIFELALKVERVGQLG